MLPEVFPDGDGSTQRAYDQRLTELTEMTGASKQETAIHSIRQAYDLSIYENAVQTSSTKMRERYANLLDRLGN